MPSATHTNASPAEIARALTDVLEPSQGVRTDFEHVYDAVRQVLYARFGRAAGFGAVKAVLRAAGVVVASDIPMAPPQMARGVTLSAAGQDALQQNRERSRQSAAA